MPFRMQGAGHNSRHPPRGKARLAAPAGAGGQRWGLAGNLYDLIRCFLSIWGQAIPLFAALCTRGGRLAVEKKVLGRAREAGLAMGARGG
jgi:hypothetical protein